MSGGDPGGQRSVPDLLPSGNVHRSPDGGEVACINEILACMSYMGEHLGYEPSTPAELATSPTRNSFHPVEFTGSYSIQKEEGDRASKTFTEGWMTIWLAHFEKVVRRNCGGNGDGPGGRPVVEGKGLTYTDFILFHVLCATEAQFDSEFYGHAWTKCDVPKLKEYLAWIKSRPNLAKYLESDRCSPWAGDSMM